jgi:predicted SprT family Zn-dependent metalloprotease
MFSVFADNTLPEETITALKDSSSQLKSYLQQARTKIHQFGFPSMHANIVIKDLSEHVNQNTGEKGDAAGLAHSKGKYMTLGLKYALEPTDYTQTVIIHEWAHLWMFNNSEGFKTAVREYYNKILNTSRTKITPGDVSTVRPQERVLKPETSDMVWSYFVRGITTKIYKSVYYNRLIQKYPSDHDDYWLGTIPRDIKGYTQLVYDYINLLHLFVYIIIDMYVS